MMNAETPAHLGMTRFRLAVLCLLAGSRIAVPRLLAASVLLTLLTGPAIPTAAAQATTLAAAHLAAPTAPAVPSGHQPELIVGFMGGRIHSNNMVHKEAVIAQDLQQRNAARAKVVVFANHDGADALKAVLSILDTNGDHTLSATEKQAARIAIYGHSWGASETVNLARSLNTMGIPVLLTIQVDSVQKLGENDSLIPPNVQLAVNFYQSEGLLRGRTAIQAQDPGKTRVLTNEQFHYKNAPVDTKEFPWFARTFMGPHIQIENDPRVWSRVEAMLQETIDGRPVTP